MWARGLWSVKLLHEKKTFQKKILTHAVREDASPAVPSVGFHSDATENRYRKPSGEQRESLSVSLLPHYRFLVHFPTFVMPKLMNC